MSFRTSTPVEVHPSADLSDDPPATPQGRRPHPASGRRDRTHPRGLAQPELPDVRPADAVLLVEYRYKMEAENFSTATVERYLHAAQLVARWLAHVDGPPLPQAAKLDIRRYIVWMKTDARTRAGKPFAEGYVNNQYRAIQQLFKFLADEFDGANPLQGMKPPRVGQVLIPVVTAEQILAMFARTSGRSDFESRRDYALLRLFLCTGARLSELTNLSTDIDLEAMIIKVVGKGNKERLIPFDPETRLALSRYLQVRARRAHASEAALWLGTRSGPMTPNGIRQLVRRRAAAVGAVINPHKFRHTFSHLWLMEGGSESDLMQLMGWTSPAMVRRYGASVAQERAIAHSRLLMPSMIPGAPGGRRGRTR